MEPEAPEPERAADNEGLDDEIALLRATIRSLAPRDHQTVRLLTQAADTLTRMVSARHEISKDDARSLAERIDSVLQHYKPLIENRDAGK